MSKRPKFIHTFSAYLEVVTMLEIDINVQVLTQNLHNFVNSFMREVGRARLYPAQWYEKFSAAGKRTVPTIALNEKARPNLHFCLLTFARKIFKITV